MDVGNGHVISDKYFPTTAPTGLRDSQGNHLYLRDYVRISGCKSSVGIIGLGYSKGYSVYFGTENSSVEWHLTPDILKRITKIVS